MPYDYVLLTGGKNNAGDFLIKSRAINLLTQHRPDRSLLELDGWKAFDSSTLELVNNAKALLLTGGPALQTQIAEKVYPMCENLDDITTPIILFGVGWKSRQGDWSNTTNFKFSDRSKVLLNKINNSGYKSSVRDFHSLNVLLSHNHKNVVMTGCPALYSKEPASAKNIILNHNSKVGFSTGVTFAESNRMKKSQQDLILATQNMFPNLSVAFHHSLNSALIEKTYGGKNTALALAQLKLCDWLDQHSIPYFDISGSESNLEQFYIDKDCHIGYRVHAHIFMTSARKPSALIAEDGRGKALKRVLGGMIFNGYDRIVAPTKTVKKFLYKKTIKQDRYITNNNLPENIFANIEQDIEANNLRFNQALNSTHCYWIQMQNFLNALP